LLYFLISHSPESTWIPEQAASLNNFFFVYQLTGGFDEPIQSCVFISLSLLIVIFSCDRISEPTPVPGLWEKIVLSDLTGIPSEYGALTSVTTHAQYEGWPRLWFVESSSTIRKARVQFHTNRINDRVLVIPRN